MFNSYSIYILCAFYSYSIYIVFKFYPCSIHISFVVFFYHYQHLSSSLLLITRDGLWRGGDLLLLLIDSSFIVAIHEEKKEISSSSSFLFRSVAIAGGLFNLVGADGNYFRDGTEPFIAIFLLFLAKMLVPVGNKRVNKYVLSRSCLLRHAGG